MINITNQRSAEWDDDMDMSDDDLTEAIQSLSEADKREMGLTRNAYWSSLYRQAENAAKNDYLTRQTTMWLESCRDLAIAEGDHAEASRCERDIALTGLVDEMADFREALASVDALFLTAAKNDA